MQKIKVVAVLTMFVLATVCAQAQEATPQPSPVEQAEAAKQAAEKQAYALLEDVVAEAQTLRLPENRVRMQITTADLLWKRDEGRARALLLTAAASLAELTRQQPDTNERQGFNQATRSAAMLRQELVLAAARHDATLAYQLFQTTRPVQQPTTDTRANNRQRDEDAALEQRLLALVAANDPVVALRKAEEMLDKGQYGNMLTSVLAQLQQTDKAAAARLTDKILARLQTDNLLASRDAGGLAFSLLQAGVRPADAPTSSTQTSTTNNSAVLNDSTYRNLMETVVSAALRATPNQTRTQGQTQTRPGQTGGRNGGGGNGPRNSQAVVQPQQTDAQAEQSNARALLTRLQALMPQVEQYLPARAPAVRQKLTELGVGNNQRANFSQFGNLMQQGTSDSLLAAAAAAPQEGLQDRLYQQAAFRALAEGNPERARQIANEHLDTDMRGVVTQAIETQQTIRKAKASQIEDVRQMLARLTSDDERVRLLLQLADAAQADDPKQGLQFLEEARTFVARRATNYQQLNSQLQVAQAIGAHDPARGFELLELGINQLNELLPAAALLSGFEVNIFRDGEMTLPGNSQLGAMVNRFGQVLATLAKNDFERSRTTADRFQYPEARLIARLAIVQGVLGGGRTPAPTNNRFGRRGFAQNGPVDLAARVSALVDR